MGLFVLGSFQWPAVECSLHQMCPWDVFRIVLDLYLPTRSRIIMCMLQNFLSSRFVFHSMAPDGKAEDLVGR